MKIEDKLGLSWTKLSRWAKLSHPNSIELILILHVASAVVSADASAGKYSVMSTILGFLGHVWTPLSEHPEMAHR